MFSVLVFCIHVSVNVSLVNFWGKKTTDLIAKTKQKRLQFRENPLSAGLKSKKKFGG